LSAQQNHQIRCRRSDRGAEDRCSLTARNSVWLYFGVAYGSAEVF
jgi:hypothetical protein